MEVSLFSAKAIAGVGAIIVMLVGTAVILLCTDIFLLFVCLQAVLVSFLLPVVRLVCQQHATTYPSDRSAQTVVCTVTLRQMLQTNNVVSLCPTYSEI